MLWSIFIGLFIGFAVTMLYFGINNNWSEEDD